MDKELSNYTTERDIELMEQLNKTKFTELIYLIILLTIAWGFGIYIMFNYLVVKNNKEINQIIFYNINI